MDTAAKRLESQQTHEEALQETVSHMKAHEWRHTPESTIQTTIEARRDTWIKEILCDLLAADIAGPAYLWAFSSFVLPLRLRMHLLSHPPNTLRVHLILSHLDRRGWLPYMQSTAPTVASWLRRVGDFACTQTLPPVDSFVHHECIAHFDELYDIATKVSGDRYLSADETIPEAGIAADLLHRLILPLGLDARLSPRSIMLGGWQESLRVHDSPGGIRTAVADLRLQELVGKAIELSVVDSERDDVIGEPEV